MPALRDRIHFSPSPPPVQVFIPAGETPPRARRHQLRRDKEYKKQRVSASDGITVQAVSPSSDLLKERRTLSSPRAPLMEKNGNRYLGNKEDHRDGASPDKPAPILSAKRDGRTSKKAESLAELNNSVKEPHVGSIAPPALVETSQIKKVTTRAGKVNAPKVTNPIDGNAMQQAPSSDTWKKSSGRSVPEVVIQTPSKSTRKKGKALAVFKEKNQNKDKDQEKVTRLPILREREMKSVGSKDDPTPKYKTEANTVVKRKREMKRAAGVKQPASRVSAETGEEHDQPAPISDAGLNGEVEQVLPTPDVPLFFNEDNHDTTEMLPVIPPSSPGRFNTWHQNAPSSSEADLEYIAPSQYSDHRQLMEAREEKGRVRSGRLGVATPLQPEAKGKSCLTKTSASGIAAEIPLHSTPLKRKSNEQVPTQRDLLDTPRTAKRKVMERERLYGLSDDESENGLVIVSVKKSKSSDKGSQKVIKVESNSTAGVKQDVSLKEDIYATAERNMRVDIEKLTADEKKVVETISATANEKKLLPKAVKITWSGINAEHTDPAEEEDVDDVFGFMTSQRKVKELLKGKAQHKTSGQMHAVEKAEIESQTQDESQFSIAFDFNKKASQSRPDFDSRNDSPGLMDFDPVQGTVQKQNLATTTEQSEILTAQLSSELSELDADLEDDVVEKVVKEIKKGKAKAQKEDALAKQMTIDEILALAGGLDYVLDDGSKKASKEKGGNKSSSNGRKLQMNDGDNDTVQKTAKSRKAKVLKLTQDDAAIAPVKGKGGFKKKGKAASTVNDDEEDDFALPPGMTSADVTKSRGGKKNKSQGRFDSTENDSKKSVSSTKTGTKPRPKPRARATKASIVEVDEDEWSKIPTTKHNNPGGAIKGKASKKVDLSQTKAIVQDSQTQPVVTYTSKKSRKRAKVSDDSDDEEKEDPKVARQRINNIQYYDSLNDYQLAEEAA